MKLIRLVASSILMYILARLYTLISAVAIFVESSYGPAVTCEYPYHVSWSTPLQLSQAADLSAMFLQGNYFKRTGKGSLILHGAFPSIRSGAAATHYVGATGVIHIHEGETANSMMKDGGAGVEKVSLFLSVTLNDFRLERYPGSHNLMSYESDLVTKREDESPLQATIRVNKVIDVDGYRLFQSSLDPDEQSTVLSISYDRPGIQPTYIGYFLLSADSVFTLLSKKSCFGRLRRELGEMEDSAPFCLLFLLILSGISSMQVLSAQQKSISLQQSLVAM